jgi:hypothetical protein
MKKARYEFKPLNWIAHRPWNNDDISYWYASTPWGKYKVYEKGPSMWETEPYRMSVGNASFMSSNSHSMTSVEDGKRQAQEHFEKRFADEYLTLVKDEKSTDSGKVVFNFLWDCGRQGSVEGIFVATRDEVEQLIGKEVYFGEVLGKHSEIYGEIKPGDITEISDDQSAINFVNNHLEGGTGFNPFDYLPEEEEEDDE